MSLNPSQDLGGHIVPVDLWCTANAGAPSVITAAGGLDNLEVTGQTIDRRRGSAMADSLVITEEYLAALGASETLSIGEKIQESDDGSSWDTAVALVALTVVATGAGNKRGVRKTNVNLRGRKRYFRINGTPDLSRANTDTALVAAVGALGGFDQLPQTV